ncbi:MAG: amino acid ABC transporter permease, partial [Desulfobacterales bacterium]|nr:amino acid ABC transporter permease [Desulfobacterales bacterium]
MDEFASVERIEDMKPPVTQVGVIGWARSNLFNGWFNSVLTLLVLFLFWQIGPPLFKWAFVDSLWLTTGQECRASDGACWSLIPSNIRFITFGFYPYDQQWRPLTAVILLVGLLIYSQNRTRWSKWLAYAWIA